MAQNEQEQDIEDSTNCSISDNTSVASSGYYSLNQDDEGSGIFGATRTKSRERVTSLAEEKVTEKHITEISQDIGNSWQRLGRELGFSQVSLDDIKEEHNNNVERVHTLLNKYIQQQGSDASKGRLAYALGKIGRRDIAEKLIGREEYIKTQGQKTLFLIEEISFYCDTERGRTHFKICQEMMTGELSLSRTLDRAEYEEAFKSIIKKTDSISINQLMDNNSKIGKEETEGKQKRLLAKAEANLDEYEGDLNEIKRSLEAQERHEDRIQVGQQLGEAEKMTRDLQRVSFGYFSWLDKIPEAYDMKPKSSYDFSIDLSATQRDLEERINMLKDMILSDGKLLDAKETDRLSKVYKNCKTMGEVIKMQENLYESHFDEDTRLQKLNKSSKSAPTRSISPEDPEQVLTIRRASTKPESEREKRSLAKQVSPPDDQLEAEEDICSTDC